MPWLGIPAIAMSAYLAVKYEGSRLWTGLSVVVWSLVCFLILGALSLVFGYGIALLKAL